jgi:hypothetical protein
MQPTLTGRNRQQEVGPAGNERPRAVIANLARSMGIRTAARTPCQSPPYRRVQLL